MSIRRLLWLYRSALLVIAVLSYGIALSVLVVLLAINPHAVLYLLDLVSPITKFCKDALWGLFPDAQWLQGAGNWLGSLVRRGMSYTSARTQAVSRVMLLDGPILVTLMAWGSAICLRLGLTWLLRRWIAKHFELVRRKTQLAPKKEKKLPRMPHIAEGPTLGQPRRE